MIHELFGSGSALIGAGERKLFSVGNGGGIILDGTPASNSSSSPSPLTSPNSSSSAATTLPGTAAKTTSAVNDGTGTGSNGATQSSNSSEGQNLRCPRCDSSNTKFCYYNNYNLTQPRHFCKTCRRYWTKGGALRNVPIGGGCRKNRTSSVSSSVVKSGATKFKSLSSAGFIGGLDHHELPHNPVMWASPHSSHILALLRGAPINPNPSPNPSPLMKEEVMNMFGANVLVSDPGGMSSHGSLGLDPLNQLPTIGLCSSLWRNSTQHQPAAALQQNQANHPSHHNGYMLAEAQNNNNSIQALYQRLKLSSGDYDSEQRSHVASKSGQGMPTSSISTSSVLESSPPGVAGGDQLGYWSSNPNLCWSDLPTSNGAYP